MDMYDSDDDDGPTFIGGGASDGEPGLSDICREILYKTMGWDELRNWLNTHTREETGIEIEFSRDEFVSPLHVICHCEPPLDIVEIFVEVTPIVLNLCDSNGWIPLHIACANNASEDVIRVLTEKFPESTKVADNSGRTPLHFAIINRTYSLTASLTHLLGAAGATKKPDETGKLPLHYACAYGASKEALEVLTLINDGAILKFDEQGFLPFHFAMSNCRPIAARHIISCNPDAVNIHVENTNQHPLDLLAHRAAYINHKEDGHKELEERAEMCLRVFLESKPKPTADFVTVLQSLPEDLHDISVVHPYVISVLNKKISQDFHTAFMIFDFQFLLLTIFSFIWGVLVYIDTWEEEASSKAAKGTMSGILFVCATYFLFRELVQLVSLVYLGLLMTWLTDIPNWLDMTCIGLSLFWGIEFIAHDIQDLDRIRVTASVTCFIYLIWFFDNLRSVFLPFAVFIEGLLYIFRRLATFLVNLFFILIAFSYMFYVEFMTNENCGEPEQLQTAQNVSCTSMTTEDIGAYDGSKPFCRFGTSFVFVFSMLLGEVEDQVFYGNIPAIVFFAIYMFLVVILLANVLIAIVTDSYGVVKKQRAGIVFWTNRLDFVAEIDVIEERLWEKMFCPFFKNLRHSVNKRLEIYWDELMGKFEDQEWYLQFGLGCQVAAWLLCGILTAGILWPAQIREKLLKKSYEVELKKVDLQAIEVEALRNEITELRGLLNDLVAEGEKGVDEMKVQVGKMKEAVVKEIEDIGELHKELFELSLE